MMAQYIDVDVENKYDVYIGDSDIGSASWETDNTKCNTDVAQQGLANCSGTGQYFILKHNAASAKVSFFDV